MKNLLMLLPVSALSLCTPMTGDFCDIYLPVKMNRPAAEAVVQLDRPASENIRINNGSYESCP